MITKNRTWIAVEIVCLPAAGEAIESAFNQLDALGTEIVSNAEQTEEPIIVSGYFETAPDLTEVQDSIVESLRIYGLAQEMVLGVSAAEIEQTDWLAEWKKHWTPTEIGRFVVAPPWLDLGETDKIVIRIEPAMAFGTGTHETTKLCIRKIDDLYQPEQTFLDVGTGTGVLAIAAAKLGAESIFACDNDKDAVEIARENAVLNNVGGRIEFSERPIDDGLPAYDFVCANLTLDVISPMLDLLIAKTREVLLLSGILGTQSWTITNALAERGFTTPVISVDGEWISVLVEVN